MIKGQDLSFWDNPPWGDGKQKYRLGLTPISEEESVTQIQQDAQNKKFNDFANDFVDFTESNPFGDILE